MWWTFLMRRKNPRGCHLWGFLVRYGEPLRIGCCCLFISVQPFAYVVANYTCYNRDKKCGEQFCHGRTPPFWWRFGSVYSISHFILIFYNFLLMKTMINIKKEAVWKFHTASWPVRESNPGLRRERASSWPLDQQAGIEATRFELATSASRTQRSTKLSHASMFLNVCFALFTSDLYILSWLRKKCKRFLKKMQIFKTNFPECGKKPGKALFYAGKWHFRLSGGSIS